MKSKTALLIAVSLMMALNVFALSTDFFRNTFDGETHLFFADHYQKGWFNPVEERWFEGFSVWTHPPLVHQLVALLGFSVGLESAYRIVQGLALVAFPVVLWFFAREIVSEKAANFAALGAPFVAGTYTFLYVFGKLPTFTAMLLVLGACTFLVRYLKSGRRGHLLAWALLGGTAAATHHHSVFVILPLLAAIIVACHWFSCEKINIAVVTRVALAAGTIIGAAVLTLLPFWWWFFTERLPMTPIPFPGRETSLFASEQAAKMLFWNIYGGAFLLIPVAAWAMVKHRAIRPVGALIVFLFILGLGGLTPLPKMFGPWWKILTYDNFAFWAAILLLIPAGVQLEAWGFHKLAVRGVVVTVGVIALLWAMHAATFTTGTSQFLRLQDWEEREIVKFLEDENHENWNYITIGMGEPQSVRISWLTEARTIDGFYYTARWRRELRESGIGMIDTLIWSPKEDREILRSILQRPWEWNLKWAIVARRELDSELIEAGWESVHPIGSDASYRIGDPVHSTVWVWRVPDNIPVPTIQEGQSGNIAQRSKMLAVWWGVIPLLTLGAAIGAVAFAERRYLIRGVLS